jgi:hypothetical protein
MMIPAQRKQMYCALRRGPARPTQYPEVPWSADFRPDRAPIVRWRCPKLEQLQRSESGGPDQRQLEPSQQLAAPDRSPKASSLTSNPQLPAMLSRKVNSVHHAAAV